MLCPIVIESEIMKKYELCPRRISRDVRDKGDLAQLVEEMRTWSIVPHPDLNLPFSELLPLDYLDLTSGFSSKWAMAMSSPVLEQGYLPSTPKTIVGWNGIISMFESNPNILVYRAMGMDFPDQTIAEVDFEFNWNDGALVANFAYSLLESSRQSQGLVSSVFVFLRDVLPDLVRLSGRMLSRLETEVSDKNHSSLRIMDKANFVKSKIQPNKPSPILMGGNDIMFEYSYS